jgi:hypothetical protein
VNRLPCGQQIAKEAIRIIVLVAERQPGDPERAAVGPLGEERRLAISGGRRDQDELVVRNPALERVDEPVAVHQAMRLWRNLDLGCQT